MSTPHLFTTAEDLQTIRRRLDEYDWYRAAFARIRSECDTMLQRGFSVPEVSGFVFYVSCKRDNARLIFDPYNPRDHVCPVCGMNYRDEPFDRAWVCSYHHWLSQMAIELGLCYAVTGKDEYAEAVRRILTDYVRYYPDYPNKDNELGTTKVFQSTYMESVWLTYLCCGYDLTNAAPCYSDEDRRLICRELFRKSADVIYDYDEKRNNRQAFNNCGMCAAALMTEDTKLFDYVLHGPHGFFYHMENSVLSDGLWYEGDNYHFATVPSIVNMAEMCLNNGLDLYHREFNGHSVRMMFDAPLMSLQPDLTFPSRKDSPYASKIAQKWYAGLYELAYRRYGSPAYGKILKAAYARIPAPQEEFLNAAGVMDVLEPASASRSYLDWRGFLSAQPDLGAEEGVPVTASVHMTGTGLTVLRRDGGRSYASVDYGNYGGGHGHPDRLALTYFADGRRWFTDYGTGQYYFDHLNWYRSTIGHNTLGIDGKRQLPAEGDCTVFGEGSLASAARCTVRGLAPDVTATRTAVLLDGGLLIDILEAEGTQTHDYDSFLHGFGTLNVPDGFSPDTLPNDCGRFLGRTASAPLSDGFTADFVTAEATLKLRVLHAGGTVFTTSAYGPPSDLPNPYPMLVFRQHGTAAKFAELLEDVPAGQSSAVTDVSADGGCIRFTRTDGRKFRVTSDENGVCVVCRYPDGSEKTDRFPAAAVPEKKPDAPVLAEEWIDFRAADGRPLKVRLKNLLDREITVQTEFLEQPVRLAAGEDRVFALPLRNACVQTGNERLTFSYRLSCGGFTATRTLTKAWVRVPVGARPVRLDEAPFTPNLTLNRAGQMAHTERRWSGPDDLSAEAMVFANGSESLTLRVHVRDDQVNFSGGKFPYDNDGIMVFFDRRTENYRTVADETAGVYGLLVRPGVFDDVATVTGVTRSVTDVSGIGVSVRRTEDGYAVLLDIPFAAVGGAPDSGVIGFDLIVNDRDSGVRREIQAVWSGTGENERIYLRDDHHSPLRYGLLEF